jgi:hypothetical protein
LPAAPTRRPPTPGSGRLSPGQRAWPASSGSCATAASKRSDLELNLGKHLPELSAAPGQNRTAAAELASPRRARRATPAVTR